MTTTKTMRMLAPPSGEDIDGGDEEEEEEEGRALRPFSSFGLWGEKEQEKEEEDYVRSIMDNVDSIFLDEY